ncbi:hypothetical protein WR25_08725 [Diploscapter pachys]|uniref:Dyp-type peroxidase n=1 Tax=Diploscapter pachys TaxID=2018661 RepID=A0A2A2JY31_9BILA|nr:hypothetical protein WR25_08725 [Diploscapter pachys]
MRRPFPAKRGDETCMTIDQIEPQAVDSPITRSALFMVATLGPGEHCAVRVREVCGDLAGLVRSVGKRVPSGNLSCVIGFGAAVWERLFGTPQPIGLHPFREFGSGARKALATPGDILLHIRAEHMDLCFELAALLVKRLGDAVAVVDELADIELDAASKPSCSHSSLTTLEEGGQEIKILRDNMPFGRPGAGEFGTYFIGYARSPAPIEQMLENMFVGKPPGNYDRLLDYSRAVTGGLYFVPPVDFLEQAAE